MTELTLTRIRRIQFILFAVVVVMLFFGGCGGQEPEGSARLEDMAVSLSGGVDINTIGTEEWSGSQNLDGAESRDEAGDPGGAGNSGHAADSGNAVEPGMKINANGAKVIYQGTAFMSTCRIIGGDSIYSVGFLGEFDGNHPAEGSYFAGRIGIEEDEIQQFSLEIPEDMLVYRGCTDDQGRWHMLLSQKTSDTVETDKKTEIWVINRKGELEQSRDITECVKEGGRIPYWMAVDSEGIYYFASSDTIRVIDIENQSVKVFHFSGEINGIGMGRSGSLYGVFNVEGNDLLGVIDTDSGSIEKCGDFPENNARPSFSALQAGVNTELLLADMGDGIWSYDGTKLKQEMALENVVASGQDILAMGFLWDGRVCIMSYEDGHYVFHYVPVEA